MWLWLPERTEGGDAGAIVRRAALVGLTHLYVRTGSSWMGFYAQDFLNRLLPVAHAAGLRVYGWDFPNLRDWRADADRGLAAIRYTTPSGDRIDGFVADVETPAEGVRLTPGNALSFGIALREGVGFGYPLIACVPRTNNLPTATKYPYPQVVAAFDAIAPMVYWINREPGADVAMTLDYLRQFNKPLLPVGQAYDARVPGGRPTRDQILRFMQVAAEKGAAAVSFWDWQEAGPDHWDAIRDSLQFRLQLPGALGLRHLPLIRPIK
jgi:hypothetical protein